MIEPNKEELIYTVRDIFSTYLTKDNTTYYYNIPEYQRGYKWNRSNVEELLNDLLAFHKNTQPDSKAGTYSKPKDDNKFYCLQNITIVPNGNGKYFDIVDGQQRLTTLYILLSYLQTQQITAPIIFAPYCLHYSVREETGRYLTSQIASGKIWETNIVPDDAKHKDEWYIRDVAKAIKEWFDDQAKDRQTLLAETILDHIQLIVNTIDAQDSATFFANLNGGKVDLDGADLIRAVLITRAAREKFGDLQDAQRVGEFRVRIGLELDEIGRWWSNKEHQTFFLQMLPSDAKSPEFGDTYPINTLYRLYYAAYKKENDTFTFHFFEYGQDAEETDVKQATTNTKDTKETAFIPRHWGLYDRLINMHTTLKDWYEDSHIYHWLGYLFFNFKGNTSTKTPIQFRKIWELWNATTDRAGFVHRLKHLAAQSLVTCYKDDLPTDKNNPEEMSKEKILTLSAQELLGKIHDLSYDWYAEQQRVKDVLLCSEILWIVENGYKNRLNPFYFHKNQEDIEHIRSCQPNTQESKNKKSKTEWKDFIEKVYDEKDHEEKTLREELLKIIGKDDTPLSDDQIQHINSKMNEYAQNSIGNLVLLNSSTNRGYGNAPFQRKIQTIIKNTMSENKYIRPYTLHVFLEKIKDEDTTWRWTKRNIQDNANEIHNKIEKFLNECKILTKA